MKHLLNIVLKNIRCTSKRYIVHRKSGNKWQNTTGAHLTNGQQPQSQKIIMEVLLFKWKMTEPPHYLLALYMQTLGVNLSSSV